MLLPVPNVSMIYPMSLLPAGPTPLTNAQKEKLQKGDPDMYKCTMARIHFTLKAQGLIVKDFYFRMNVFFLLFFCSLSTSVDIPMRGAVALGESPIAIFYSPDRGPPTPFAGK